MTTLLIAGKVVYMNDITKEEIKSIRGKLGISQQKFAEKLGASVSAVSQWERGLFTPIPSYQKKIRELGNGRA